MTTTLIAAVRVSEGETWPLRFWVLVLWSSSSFFTKSYIAQFGDLAFEPTARQLRSNPNSLSASYGSHGSHLYNGKYEPIIPFLNLFNHIRTPVSLSQIHAGRYN